MNAPNSMLAKLANNHAKPQILESKVEVSKKPEDTNKMIQSSRHGGRLLAAALGQEQRNESLLQSRKVKTGSKDLVHVSATDLAKMKHEEFLTMKREAIRKKKLAAAKAQGLKIEEAAAAAKTDK